MYNENDPYAAEWLRNLVAAGHIADGDVLATDIQSLTAADVSGHQQCHFFAGIGLWSLALRLAGWPDDREVWTGSCPCQPFSNAGKGKGVDDDRHLWPVWRDLIGERRPAVVFGEQVTSPAGRAWLDSVSLDLEALDYAVGSADLCAAGIGAPHVRQRLFWVAHTERGAPKRYRHQVASPEAFSCDATWQQRFWVNLRDGGPDCGKSWRNGCPHLSGDGKIRPLEPGISPMANGYPGRVGQLRAYGNAIVPALAAAFVRSFMEVIG